MVAYSQQLFSGIVPRLDDRALPPNHATIAHDVDLSSGTLRSFLEPKLVHSITRPNVTRIYADGCHIFGWDRCVSVAPYLPDCPRLFVTGRADYPEVMTYDKDSLAQTYRRLGVPAPRGIIHAVVVNPTEPPANLTHITAIEGTAILAGSIGNKLLFSKNLRPHDWRLSQELTLDDNIIALGSIGNKLYVATDGHPYHVQADAGCDERACRHVVRYPEAHPMINCHTGNGAIVTPYGFIYASTTGLILLSEGSATNITDPFFGLNHWRRIEPHTIRLGFHHGALFIVTEKVSYILWLEGIDKHKRLITISDKPIAMHTTRQGELLMLNAPEAVADEGEPERPNHNPELLKPFTDSFPIYQWNAGARYRPFHWRSRPIRTGFLFDLTRVKCDVKSGNFDVSTESKRAEIMRPFPQGERVIPFSRHGRLNEFFLNVRGAGELVSIGASVCDIELGIKNE